MKKTTLTLLLSVLFCMQTNAQGIEFHHGTFSKIFESEPGAGWSSAQSFFTDFDNRFDANGDGAPDLILTREDSDGNLQAMRVVDAASGTMIIDWQNLVFMLGEKDGMKFFGFVDPDGDGIPDALFNTEALASRVWLINTSDDSLSFHTGGTLLGVMDLTGDSYVEILILLEETQQMQVWSSGQ